MRKATLVRLVALLVLGTSAAVVLLGVDARKELLRFLQWVEDLGAWGPVVLAAAYIPASVFLVPGSVLTLGAGFAFKLVRGTIAVSIGSTLGAAAAFLVGRFLARGWVEAKVARDPRFRAIDQAVAEQGFLIVLLTRLSPAFPFTLLNYAYGLTRVRFRDYFLASWLGMLPGTILYVYLGTLVGDLADLIAGRVESGLGGKIFFAVGLVLTVILTVLVTRIARKALDRAIAANSSEQHPSR